MKDSKKVGLFLVQMVLIITMLAGGYNVQAAIRGDINLDGSTNSTDYALLKRHILGTSTLSGKSLIEADVNLDGIINSTDYALLRIYILGLIEFDTREAFSKEEDVLMTYSGLTKVSYGGYLNGESFQQDGIIYYNGYQYTAFWNTNRNIVLARRAIPGGTWQKFDFTDYKNTADDAHNTISIGICPNDGTLHLAFDHHGNDLHYRKSVEGFLTNPEKHSWSASSFGSTTNNLGDTKVSLVTYPKFVITPQGNMLLEYRYGTSGSGDQHLLEYSGTTHSWTNIGKYIDGISTSINAYPHGLSYGKGSNRLHMTWCWRETPDASTNQDLYYIYSDDNGRTWKNNAGTQVAKTGSSFVTKSSPGIKVWTIDQNRGLINQEHHFVDSVGRVHVLLSHMPDSQSDDKNFNNARSKSVYFHYRRNTDGVWKRNNMGFSVVGTFRGKIAASSINNLYAVLPDLRIAFASEQSGWTDWKLIDTKDQGRFFSDPLIDTNRLMYEDKLTVYYPVKNSPNIYTLTYNLD